MSLSLNKEPRFARGNFVDLSIGSVSRMMSPAFVFVIAVGMWSSAAAAFELASVYEISDAGCSACFEPAAASGACACPAGSGLALYFRVLNDCEGAGILHGGNIRGCVAAVTNNFGGGYQQDDNVTGGVGCRFGNPYNGNTCTCPAGFSASSYRTLSTPGVGSHVVLCYNPSEVGGGAYQQQDDGTCYAANVYTGGCTCPAAFQGASSMRSIIDGPTGSMIVFCLPSPTPPPQTQICAGQTAALNGVVDTTAAVQACIDQTPAGGTLALPAGIYGVASQITINKNIIVTTQGYAMNDASICGLNTNACATFFALPACCSVYGIVVVNAPGAVLNHIIIDGNRANRAGTPAWTDCVSLAYNRYTAMNAYVMAANVTFEYSASVNALCASALIWQGDQCDIKNAYIAGNGDHPTRVSDGITMLQCQSGSVKGVTFVDNTDVNFIMGCGTGTTVDTLTITMSAQQSYAGVMLDNFDGSTCGDYQNMSISNVAIDCAAQQCDFGANFGPHAWYASANIVGGAASNFNVQGAKQGINCGGAGVVDAPLSLTDMTVGAVPAAALFNCGAHATSQLNIETGSYVQLSNTPAATHTAWNGCP
jgi:hypothetical protein